MILRVSLFISALALFYYYCKNDPEAQNQIQKDTNLIESPKEASPTNQYEFLPEESMKLDSSSNFISVSGHTFDSTPVYLSSSSQNY